MERMSFDYRKEIEQLKKSIDRLLPEPPRVLLVDDDQYDVCLACRELSKFYCDVTVCHDPTEACTLLKDPSKTFDIVFLDLIMPKVSGLEVMQSAIGLLPGTHFVLVTGYPASSLVDQTVKLGAVLASKPVTEKTLRLFLRRKDE